MTVPISETEQRAKCIAMLFTSFGQGSDAERMATYVEILKDVPAEVLSKACKKAMMKCKYLPSIAELVESAQDIVAEANGTHELPFAEAWKEIERELHNTFVYGKPKFSRPEIEQAVNCFGWQELCEMKTSDIPIIRAQLKGMYEAICQRNKEKNMNHYVLGTAMLIEDEDGVRLLLK